MNKWIKRFKEALDLEAEGNTPTERMEDLLKQLRQLSDGGDSLEGIAREDRMGYRPPVQWI